MSKTKRTGLGLILCCLVLCFLLVGCFSTPEMQVRKTLDARQSALNARDVDSYIKLFHPDYQYRADEVETITSKISKRFSEKASSSAR